MSKIFDEDMQKRQEELEKMPKTIVKHEPDEEYKRVMKEADERIREDHIRQAKMIRRANDCIAL